ncbi:hypothetical protein R1C46_26420 [Bacillus tropicus]
MKVDITPKQVKKELNSGDLIITNDETYMLVKEYGGNDYGLMRFNQNHRIHTISSAESFEDVIKHIETVWGEVIQEHVPKAELLITRA